MSNNEQLRPGFDLAELRQVRNLMGNCSYNMATGKWEKKY